MNEKERQQKNQMNEIVEFIGYTGYFGFTVKDMPKYALAIPKLVAHKVIVVGAKKSTHKGEEDEAILRPGEKFVQASLKGGYIYIREVENEINPSVYRRYWNYVSNNPLLSNFIAGLFGGVLGSILLKLL